MQPGAGSKLNGPHLPAEDLRPFALPLRTRLALWVMFGAAMCAAAFLLEHAIAILNENEKAALPAVTTELRRAAPSIAVPLPTQEEPIKVNPLQAPAAPKKEMPPEIAELEVLAALTRDDPTFDARTALAHIQPYTDSSNEAVKNAAAKLLARVLGEHDAKARAHARRVAEGAQERVDAGEFAEAEELLKAGLSALPADVAWTAHGREQLEKQWASVTAARANAKIKAAKEFEAAWRGDDETAKIRAEEWLKHRDPEIKTAIEILRIKIDDEQRTVRVQRQHRETAMRAAWLEFFETFSSAIADGDFEAAQTLCKPAPEALILKGGVAQPVNVLAGCLADLAAIRKLQDMVLDKAKNSKRAVHLVLRKGQVHGTLDGVEGRQIFLSMTGGARVGVKVETITAAGIVNVLDQKELDGGNLQPALWTLRACENSTETALAMARSYATARMQLPVHWTERLRMEKFRQLDQNVGAKFSHLTDALSSGNVDTVKVALAAARAAVKAFEEFEPLSELRKKVLANAEKMIGKAERSRIVLQNGVAPYPDYTGIDTDQISQYRESQKKTDIGVQYGLKVGASGGLQRVLIRFDGLEAAIGKARVKKATLEMYQIESPQSNGSMLALFRLKKGWAPDAGTWISFDSAAKNTDWAIAGCSGDADVESKEDSKVIIDARRNVWRSFDVTQYAQDILAGKTQNSGFLLRVINGETDHHVRFFPESDLESSKDKSLRPKLTLEVEQD